MAATATRLVPAAGLGTAGRLAATAAALATADPLDFPLVLPGMSRSSLVWETRFVMLAFLWPAVTSAVLSFSESVAGVHQTRFADLVPGNAPFNLAFGMISYLPLAAVVPIALHLLARTGQGPRWLRLGWPRFSADVFPGLGLAAAAFGAEIVLIVVLRPLLVSASSAVDQVPVGHVPTYYIAYGLLIAAVTSVTEEVLVNGYLVTRLGQIGWTARSALVLSLILRTSYHVYYGIGFVLTVPFGWFVTRSFQKHRRLGRAIAAHFIFDASIMVLSLTSGAAKIWFLAPSCGLALVSVIAGRSPAAADGPAARIASRQFLREARNVASRKTSG